MTNSLETAVEFCDASLRLGRRNLVSNLNFTVYQAEALVLLGRSGSGKTTTLKMINHLVMPTSGSVLVQGKPTHKWNAIELRRRIGYAIQGTGLFPHFSIEENIGLVPKLLGWERDRIHARVCELLEMVGLEPERFARRYPNQLSGGQQQRVGVARALAADPPILLMDEPFGALDPITRLELQQEFRRLQRQLHKTVIFVTHDIQEAMTLATRIGLMMDGHMEVLAEPEEFLRSSNEEAQAFLQCLKIPQ